MQHHDIHRRIGKQSMAYDTFHSSYLLNGIKAVGIIVHRRFHKKQIDFGLGQHIVRQAECSGRTARRRNPGIDKGKLCIRETLLQIFTNHIPPSLHFCDGTSQKSNRTNTFFLKHLIRVTIVTS